MLNLGFLAKATTFGLGRHRFYLTNTEEFLLIIKWDNIAIPFATMSVAVPKLAVVIFLAKAVGPTNPYQIRALYISVVTLIVLSAVNVVLVFAQCSPPSASWRPNIPHKCWNPASVTNYIIFVGGVAFLCSDCEQLLMHPQLTQLSTTSFWQSFRLL